MRLCATFLCSALVLLFLTGCGGATDPMSNATARSEAQNALATAATAITADIAVFSADRSYTPTELPDSPQVCAPWWSDEEGRVWGYSIEIAVPDAAVADDMLAAAHTHWRRQNYVVKGRTLNTDPAMHASNDDGFNYELQFSDDRSIAYLTGSTPCIPQTTATQ